MSLSGVERALTAGGLVTEARALVVDGRLAVVAVPGADGRAVLEAEGKRALDARLAAWLLQSVERIALPRRWRYVNALPVNSQGKSTESLLAVLFRPAMPAVRWTRRDADSAAALLDIVPELAVFDGHFPGAPLLPGVAQLGWAIGLARQCFGGLPRVLRTEVLKFQRPVPPGTTLELALRWQPASGMLDFSYGSPAGRHASGRVVFGTGGYA